MPRRKKIEDHDNHEAWAIPYGDLVTLLLAFFVVMYAMSNVNEGKYRVLSDSLSVAFRGQSHAAPSQAESQAVPDQHTQPDPTAATTSSASLADASALELKAVADEVDAAMASLIEAGQVHVRRHDNWVVVDISSDILFSSGQAQLAPPAIGVLQRLADALRPFPNAIRVTGHTDNRPIRTVAFPSNWELSTARAASVVHLFMDRGVAPQRLSVMGFGEYRPVMANTTQTGRNANRRVEVMIMGRDASSDPSAP